MCVCVCVCAISDRLCILSGLIQFIIVVKFDYDGYSLLSYKFLCMWQYSFTHYSHKVHLCCAPVL